MKTYTFSRNGKTFIYFYDRFIRLWTLFEVDKYGHQVSEEAEYYPRKGELSEFYPEADYKTQEDPKSYVEYVCEITSEIIVLKTSI